jgi:U2 small nuclear ribonucleoprotein A'
LNSKGKRHANVFLFFSTGYKIPLIENLGATLDQFDTIDFSDNEVRKVDNFPFLPRIKTLLFNNNRICRFGEGIEESLPKLDSIILTNNNIQELADIETLSSAKSITMISLLHNPVVAKANYRLYTIHKFPNLRVLDFKKVKQTERDEAKTLFKSKHGKEQLREIKKRAKTFTPGEGAENAGGRPTTNASGLTPEQVRTIKAAIARATTLEEIERYAFIIELSLELPRGMHLLLNCLWNFLIFLFHCRLNHMLRTGQIPGEERQAPKKSTNGEEEEMDED